MPAAADDSAFSPARPVNARVDSRCERLLLAGLAEQEIAPDCAPTLLAYLAELEKWNAAYNLSGIRNAEEIVTRHLLDSLAVLPHVRGSVIDIGSGAGLPGIILAIVNPALRITVLDSNGKKARFMRHAVRALDLKNVDVAEARAEDFRPPERFDCVVSRAFGGLGDFLRVTAHLAGADGKWLAMKGKLDPDEQTGLPPGMAIVDVKPLTVPGLDEARHLIVVARR